MGAARTVFKTVISIIGVLLLVASFGTSIVAEEIDTRISEDCEDLAGAVGQVVGADEGQCQDARDLRDTLKSLTTPLLIIGAILFIMPILTSYLLKPSDN